MVGGGVVLTVELDQRDVWGGCACCCTGDTNCGHELVFVVSRAVIPSPSNWMDDSQRVEDGFVVAIIAPATGEDGSVRGEICGDKGGRSSCFRCCTCRSICCSSFSGSFMEGDGFCHCGVVNSIVTLLFPL